MLRPLVPLAAVALVAFAPASLEAASGGRVEAAIAIDGVDAAEFSASLAERLRAPMRLVSLTSPPRAGIARLEFRFDARSGIARLAYHDGVSEAPALVVIAEFARGGPPAPNWFLAQAAAAIESFGSCEAMISAPNEILDPWSPSDTARAQRWAEVLDPWLGCAGNLGRSGPSEHVNDYLLLEGEVLDPWSEAAYAERGVALVAPPPGVPQRPLHH